MTDPHPVADEATKQLSYEDGVAHGFAQGFPAGVLAAKAYLLGMAIEAPTSPDMQALVAQMAKPLNTPIEDFDFTVRIYNILKRNGLHTIAGIMSLKASDYPDFRNLRPEDRSAIKSTLASYGYILPDDHPLILTGE
jgi:DNA-directed RNA polymerase alpha subunit